MDLNGVLLGTEDPARLRAFYSKLFGAPTWEDGGYSGWRIGTGSLTIGAHDQVRGTNGEPGRVIWNIESSNVSAEFERMVAAGATVVREPYRPDEQGEGAIATLADPDGNYFQIVSPM